MNELLFFITLIIMFSLVVLINKFFKKAGLFAFISMAVILANIEVSCQVNMFGFPDGWVTLGNVAFASIFLATDILNECYGYKESKKAVNLAFIIVAIFLLFMQIDTLFIPSSEDYMFNTMKEFFGINGAFIWITLSSVICFYLANLLDVWLFDKIKAKTGDKKLWLRNNVSTMTANCLENFLFAFCGYYLLPLIFTGQAFMPLNISLGIALSTCLIEVVIGILDTPFVYLAKKLNKKEEN